MALTDIDEPHLRTLAERTPAAREVFRELDATRARLEQAESKRHHETQHLLDCCAERDKALAASQAECLEQRYALRDLWRLHNGDVGAAMQRGKIERQTPAVVSRAPCNTEALAGMLAEAWAQGAIRCGRDAGCPVNDVAAREMGAEYVARVLDRSDTTEGGRG